MRPVMLVAGARPNFVKIAPVQRELDRRGVTNVLVHTGQHYDASMSDVFFEELGIRTPEHHLDVGSASHAVQTARIMEAFEPVVERVAPSWVVVFGDVNSTVACALVAAKLGVRVAHVEAGLRSRDWSMPEEVNRLVTDRLSHLLLSPSADGVANLRAEGYEDERIGLVGNVMVDSLLGNLERASARPVLAELGLEPHQYALLTLHRPSNVDDPRVFAGLMESIGKLAVDVPVVYPVHPRARPALDQLGTPTGVLAVEPVGYLDAIALQASARLVLTDSGGLQEETTVLGVPCLTLRTTTERPITIDQGTNELVGVDPATIGTAVRRVLASPPPARRPALWDGHAAGRIVDALISAEAATN
jgi:UDP-N-acetylglucosamine 2-epimerase (non-hydrolysing)